MDSPIITATWQAGLLSALSNILAQLITCWRANTPWQINLVDVFHFVLFSVLACPPNYIWQSWLEAKYPAHGGELTLQEKEAIVDRTIKGDKANDQKILEEENTTTGKSKMPRKDTQPHLSKKNTAIKFTLDQTLGAGINTVLFIAGMGLIRGQPWSTIQDDLLTQFWPMILAGQKLWPLVSVLNFTLIPLEYRMLVGNTAGLFWGIYLSLVSSSGQ